MYCHIIYADNRLPADCQKSRILELVNNTASPPSSKTTITPTNKTLTINPDCYVHILLEYVRDTIELSKSVDFDFCDEYGRLLNINTLKECEYATKVFKHKSNYIVVLHEKDESGNIIKIEPYVHKTSKAIIDICARLTRNLIKGKSMKRMNVAGLTGRDSLKPARVSSGRSIGKASTVSTMSKFSQYSNSSGRTK